MRTTKEQIEYFETNTRTNASLIHGFCRERGMSPMEAGAACYWLVHCIKKAVQEISNSGKNPITND